MKTKEEFKAELLASNPSRFTIINGESIEQSDEEFNEIIDKKVEMLFEQQEVYLKKQAEKAAKISAYEKLGLTPEEIQALIPPLDEFEI
jgi:hypothetical protein